MQFSKVIQWVVFVVAFSSGALAHAEHTRVTNPNTVSFEGLGRSLVWGVNYDRVMDDQSLAGFGYGSVTAGGNSSGMLSAYYHYLFMKEQSSPFAGAGFGFLTNHSDVEGKKSKVGNLTFSSSPIVPHITVGFENRTDLGFLFRIAGYVLMSKTTIPWVGVSFGYAF